MEIVLFAIVVFLWPYSHSQQLDMMMTTPHDVAISIQVRLGVTTFAFTKTEARPLRADEQWFYRRHAAPTWGIDVETAPLPPENWRPNVLGKMTAGLSIFHETMNAGPFTTNSRGVHVSQWWFVLFLGIPVLWRGIRLIRHPPSYCCSSCSYDLRGTVVADIHECPECGAKIPDKQLDAITSTGPTQA